MVDEMQYSEQIHNYIDTHKREIIDCLKELVKIPSIRQAAEENAPFGKECAKVLEFTQKLYEKNGFKTELNQNGGYLLSYYGAGEKSLGIFAHADVVPVSDDWIYTKPFEPLEKGGCIIGRGTLDDKSAVVCSLYCAKMLKELKIPFNSRLVMFTGANEESGMQDIRNYMSEHTKPDFSLVADTAFPLYRGNKGRLKVIINSNKKLSKGIVLSGGTGAAVIGEASAIIPFSQSVFDELSKIENERIDVNKENDFLKIKAKGIAKHAALPEGSINAVAILTKILSKIKAFDENDCQLFEDIYNMSNCYYGEFFKIENEDSEYRKLTCVLTEIKTLSDGRICLNFNIRYGAEITLEEIMEKIKEKVVLLDFEEPNLEEWSIPDTLPKDNKFVKALLGVYSKYTGEENPPCYINAGGTYRQFLQNAVEIGTTLIWDGDIDLPQGHGSVHQPDEFINIEGFLKAIELTALMLIEIDKYFKEC